MNNHEPTEQLAPYVDALLACTNLLSQILDHMYHYEHSAPDAPPPPIVLAELLEGTLAPQLNKRPKDLARATTTLERTAKAIEREIYLVADDPPNRAERRRRRGGDCRLH